MIQFNCNRFGKLAKWSLANDRSYFVRCFMQVLVVLTLIFLAFTTNFFKFTVNGSTNPYQQCAIVVALLVFIDIIIGPSLMFQSMKGKHDRQTLQMLPASNFEKYIMRYATWMLLIPLYLAGFFGADLIQYLVNVVGGNDQVMFVTPKLITSLGVVAHKMSVGSRSFMMLFFVTLFWLHSVYALGATFFRSHKYAAIFTTFVIIVIGMLDVWLFVGDLNGPLTVSSADKYMAVIYGLWAIVNLWLSYRLFCRTQVIGRFVNL